MTDYISRQAAIDKANELANDFNKTNQFVLEAAIKAVIDVIENAPTADVRENVKAKIIDNGGEYQCSNCKVLLSSEINYVLDGYKPISFCPNCGADMRTD